MSNNKSSNSAENNETNILENASRAVKKTFDLYTSLPSDNNEKTKNKEEIVTFANPEIRDSLKKIQSTVKKEKVDYLINHTKEKSIEIFANDNNSLTQEQNLLLLKKLNKWESTEEVNVANASVMVAWMEKFGKSK
ncbi:MAG: hypothetical protein H7263_05400 [Candidatus Sericytochromatia bacterium]|nr:hypothetical protein [Candidatus Sericytochromatia bacterium]